MHNGKENGNYYLGLRVQGLRGLWGVSRVKGFGGFELRFRV